MLEASEHSDTSEVEYSSVMYASTSSFDKVLNVRPKALQILSSSFFSPAFLIVNVVVGIEKNFIWLVQPGFSAFYTGVLAIFSSKVLRSFSKFLRGWPKAQGCG